MSVQPERRAIIRAHLLMILATVLIATSFPVGAAITHGLDSLVLTLLRFLLAALLFAPIVIWRHGLTLPDPMSLMRYAALSAALVGFFWAMFVALRHTSTLNTGTIFALIPAVTAAFSFLLLKQKLGHAAKLALPLGMIGATWVIFRGDLQALLALKLGRGDAIFLAGTVSLGCYGTLVKFLHRGEPVALMTFWTLVTGTVWLLILSATTLVTVDWHQVPLRVFGGIAYLAVFTTLITFFSMQWSATIIGPTKVMSYTYLNPALVLLLGLALGDAPPPLITYPGLGLILMATLVLQAARTPSEAMPDQQPQK